MRFSSEGDNHLLLGMADNIVVSLLFSTKRHRPSARTLIPAKLPEQFDAIHTIPKDVTNTIGRLRQHFAAQPSDREHWLRCIEQARADWRIHLKEPTLSVIEGVLFERTMMRYIPLVIQERVRVGGVRFNNAITRQCCIIATRDIEEDDCLWELVGILSSDSLENSSLSTMIPHACQKLDSSPRLMAGPAHLVNHSCRPNAKVGTYHSRGFELTPIIQLVPLPELPTLVITTLRVIRSGEEVTVDYGTGYWGDRPCMCIACTPVAPSMSRYPTTQPSG
jgi:hypothetical protein